MPGDHQRTSPKKPEKKIYFVPSESVVFKYLQKRQVASLKIVNNWDRPIIFKMKSTRPNLFRMRPVYGKVSINETRTVLLDFCGMSAHDKPPCAKDRFTIVIAPAPADMTNPATVWKENSAYEVKNQTVKKVIRIQFGELNTKLLNLEALDQKLKALKVLYKETAEKERKKKQTVEQTQEDGIVEQDEEKKEEKKEKKKKRKKSSTSSSENSDS